MRIRDWSSDVCSSDLPLELRLRALGADHKRLLCLMELFQTRDNYLAATMEHLSVNVNLDTRRSKAGDFQQAVRGAGPVVVGVEERRVGNEWVSQGGSWGSRWPEKKNLKQK